MAEAQLGAAAASLGRGPQVRQEPARHESGRGTSTERNLLRNKHLHYPPTRTRIHRDYMQVADVQRVALVNSVSPLSMLVAETRAWQTFVTKHQTDL